ncbi:serine phosphatase RsbU (regulator of sigma subunit)/anti-sigma regulatory factor (Ser/Thr protein kinase) [Kineococcus radiotolerans]|uniref:Serine phosphatase RsbU (Regulator of sigma subunit)/anti-sigma regulatory factor (Ser/Thr protein kinase) n=1 Tax=Kineococcus radiotolerans TaxID=131568 RepID=A0A7W4XX62_KINRA|nr:SpoIIE family protein phosphatase [Kineococcus radiotolerans]MBB2901172.1 serine phosphatase RsbU (regulator of sigma subunit)/anti-sigma regulatory factor (Ser/Thr protein kinase) [Kineococcus radiotolerans]
MAGSPGSPGPAGGPPAADTTWRALARCAVELSSLTGLEEFQTSLVRHARTVFAAAGCGVVVPTPEGTWRLLAAAPLDPRFAGRFPDEPRDSDLPAIRAARDGVRCLLPDRAAAVLDHPRMADVVDLTGRPRWALLPLRAGGSVVGSLALSWEEPGPFDAATATLLDAFAAQCAPTLARLLATREEEAATTGVRRLSTQLQRSSLAVLPERDGLSLAAGYQPVQASADIGGDWYDAFENRSGDLVLVLGDVSGHDERAAAAMSQVRVLLRGVVWGSERAAGEVLHDLDEVLTALEPGTLASVVLAVLHDEGAAGVSVRWASAGHPSPLVRRPDRSVDLLRDGALGGSRDAGAAARAAGAPGTDDEGLLDDRDPILGVDPAVERREHRAHLGAGSALLLYSDGVVETRGEELGAGLARLAGRFAALDLADPAAAARELMAATGGGPGDVRGVEDDRTLLLAVVLGAGARRAADGTGAPGDRRAPAEAVASRTLTLPAEPQSPSRARQVVRRTCTRSGWTGADVDTAVLLTSELVTNAVVHGRSETLLTVRATPEVLRVEVWDDNHRVPELLEQDESALSGRGLHLVQACADDWGVQWPTRAHDVGKGVWFTLHVS